jgi:hypothetical protein
LNWNDLGGGVEACGGEGGKGGGGGGGGGDGGKSGNSLEIGEGQDSKTSGRSCSKQGILKHGNGIEF